jgi:hypothetical protein
VELAGHQWLSLVILAIQEADIRRFTVQSQANSSHVPILKKSITNRRMVEWLKV